MRAERENQNRRADRYGTLGFLASPIEDRRLPASDVMGYLADRVIRRDDLELIAEQVRAEWPSVQRVLCGVMDERPYFSIHIEPFSRAAQQDHWPLADWIEMALRTTDCQFFFLPAKDDQPLSSEVVVYPLPSDDDRSNGQRAA